MFSLSEKQVESALKKCVDPHTQQDLVTGKGSAIFQSRVSG